MKKEKVAINSESITVVQFLKWTGTVLTGGEGKSIIRDGDVMVNDEVETRPGRKLYPGDEIKVNNVLWAIIVRENFQ